MWKKVDFESLKPDVESMMSIFTTTNSINDFPKIWPNMDNSLVQKEDP